MDRYIRTVKLKGSPVQIAWATDIRARLVAEAEQACRTFLASLSGDPELRKTQQQETWAAMTAFAVGGNDGLRRENRRTLVDQAPG